MDSKAGIWSNQAKADSVAIMTVVLSGLLSQRNLIIMQCMQLEDYQEETWISKDKESDYKVPPLHGLHPCRSNYIPLVLLDHGVDLEQVYR